MSYYNYTKGFNFKVYIEGVPYICAKISGVERVQDTETLSEGGINDRVYTIDAAPKTEKVMIMEKALSENGGKGIPFWTGYRTTLDVFVFVMDEHKNAKWMYIFDGCYIKKISYSDLDASKSELVLERVEISYQLVKKMPLSFT